MLSNLQTLSQYLQQIEQYYKQTQIELKQLDSNKQRQNSKVQFIFTDLHEITHDCQDGLKRIRDIVADLKLFARPDNNEQSLFYLQDAIKQTLKFVHHEIKYNCNVNLTLLNPCLIEGVSSQINQVLINLIMNAQQACTENCQIDVTLEKVEQMAKLSVSDNGCGIDEKHLGHLFEPFFTTKAVGKGTGLGLSISYGIIEQHGGRIEVSSQLGVGSVFTLYLPLSKDEL